nr:MAG TPA: hypothetical protein [Caudoviricetes sp.]
MTAGTTIDGEGRFTSPDESVRETVRGSHAQKRRFQKGNKGG